MLSTTRFAVAFALVAFAPLAVTACTVAADGGDDDANTRGACDTAADCDDGAVCVAYGDRDPQCTVTCSIDADTCSGNATCGGLGSVDVNVCEDEDRGGDAQDPAEQPRIPCASDDECDAIDPGTICAQYAGEKACTLPCDVENDCSLPAIGGVAIDFLTCGADDADASRTACIPDEDCLLNPLPCITTDFPSEGEGEGEGEGENDGNTAGACDDGEDCGTGYACVRFGDAPAECTRLCDSGADCDDDAACAPIDLLDLSVCEDDDRRGGSADEPDPAEAPAVQCADDDECASASPGTVCAEWHGDRQCALPCSSESACDLPSVNGFTFDFMTCGEDEGASRDVCIPDEACFASPLDCMDF